MKHILFIALGTSIFLINGCVTHTNDTYYWGNYQNLIHQMYSSPGKAPPSTQINTLLTDIHKAESLGKPVPPGVYAHLGFMYAANGELDKSLQAFNIEKQRFPESTVFIEGIENRAIGKFGDKKESEK